ncbi:MAG: SMP-30/gluconolactonase/LRE family protein [Acidobacteriota bacterium]
MADREAVRGDVQIVVDTEDLCGENPVWDELTRCVYWTDQGKSRFQSLQVDTGRYRLLSCGLQINGFRLNQPSGFVVTNDSGVWLWDGSNGLLLLASEADGKTCRLNDCVADPEGRLFTGSHFYQTDQDYPTGHLFRVDTDGKVCVVDEGILLSNGLAFSIDDKQLYFTDSAARCIYAYDYDRGSGRVANRRTLVRVPVTEGLPDGLVVDAEGFLWSARWYGSEIVRYDPDGSVERRISIPAKQVSCLCFAGNDLEDVYVTTAGESWPAPLMPPGYDPINGFFGGPLYRLKPGIPGRPTLKSYIRATREPV